METSRITAGWRRRRYTTSLPSHFFSLSSTLPQSQLTVNCVSLAAPDHQQEAKLNSQTFLSSSASPGHLVVSSTPPKYDLVQRGSSFITMRSTSNANMSIRSIRSLNPLPVIAEDRSSIRADAASPRPPTVPPRAWNRPVNKIFGLGPPPRMQHDISPPAYTRFDSDEAEGPHGEKLADVRKGLVNNKHIAKRGGWKTLVLILLLVVLCITALVVGLVVGLRNRKNKSS